MNPASVIVHIVSPESTPAEAGRTALTETETKRAASFRFPADAARWTGFRAALRRILGESVRMAPRDVPLVLTEFGKPVLAPPFDHLHFSLSHCNDLAIVALCTDGPVGIDLEPLSRAPDLSGCEDTFCHPDEIAGLPGEPRARCIRMLEIWTAKEALLKALGTGFLHPPETIRIHMEAPPFTATCDSPLPGIEGLTIHRLHRPSLAGYCAALSIPASVSRIEIVPCEASTSGPDSVITGPRST